MLVLSRKKSESIVIGDQIKVEVLKIKGNTIRLGISAPKDVKVLRGELSPFEIEVECDHESEPQQVAEEKAQYKRQSAELYPVSKNDSVGLANPFAVIAG